MVHWFGWSRINFLPTENFFSLLQHSFAAFSPFYSATDLSLTQITLNWFIFSRLLHFKSNTQSTKKGTPSPRALIQNVHCQLCACVRLVCSVGRIDVRIYGVGYLDIRLLTNKQKRKKKKKKPDSAIPYKRQVNLFIYRQTCVAF